MIKYISEAQEQELKKQLGARYDEFIHTLRARLCENYTKPAGLIRETWRYSDTGFRFTLDVAICADCKGLIAMYPLTGKAFELLPNPLVGVPS